MEALLILGLMGAGYLINKDTDENEQTDNTIINMPKSSSVYDANNYKETRQIELDNATRSLEKAKTMDGVIYGDGLQKMDPVNAPEGRFVYSNISGGYMKSDDFLKDDRGVQQLPFFKKAPANINFDVNPALDKHQGNLQFKGGKKGDRAPLFAPQKNVGNVFGSTFNGAQSDKSRYNIGDTRKNELPFTQEKIQPIDVKSTVTRDIGQLMAKRSATENLRTINNQKETFGGKIIPGKYIDQRGKQPEVMKNRPYRDYINSPLRNIVSVAETEGPMQRPEQIIPLTNRTFLNKQPLGVAGTTVPEEMRRPNARKSSKFQLGTSTGRNVRGENKNDYDYNSLGYKANPNEREVTENRTHELNVKTYISGGEIGLQDKVKPTVKETTMYSDIRNPNTYVSEDTSRINFCNMETDPTREILSQGREPTLSNVKLLNSDVNVDIHKLDSDYMTQHGGGITNIFQQIPQDHVCQITQDKITLDNDKLSDRIYPELLDPFRENPLTQPLSSYAYP